MTDNATAQASAQMPTLATRGYQQEMLEESLKRNIVIALDTGAGKTHIAVLRLKLEVERESRKVSWFLVPTVALAQQQQAVIVNHIAVPVGLISGANEPDQWKDPALWRGVLVDYRIIVSTPDVLLNALRHGYIHLGRDIGFLVFDEAHHAADRHSYNLIMREFYAGLPPRGGAESADAGMRPMILGLTASPIFGGDVEMSLRQIERNLDATVCAPLRFRSELEGFVHRPQFKHVIYAEPMYPIVGTLPSSSLQSLKDVVASLKIEEDPWVIDRRAALRRLEPGPDRTRIDQRLSRAIDKHDTFAHKGLRDFERAAEEICAYLGAWAADWYIQQVCEQAMRAGELFPEFSFSSSESERNYLLKNLARIEIAPVPEGEEDGPADVMRRTSDKVDKLIDKLLEEKTIFEDQHHMEYRGLVFVTRRDAVLALTAILARHPRTAHVLSVGSLLGESGSARRRAFLDITRRLLRQPASATLDAFRIGDLNLIIATAVAEEGLDIQACCNVVRWDPPANMVSWTQSRGRARQERSSFVVMLSDSLAFADDVRKWVALEHRMTELYNTSQELRALLADEDELEDDDEDNLRFTVEATGAVLTGNSAITHIVHFCAILPYPGQGHHSPLFDIDPPDYPFEWHADAGPRVPYKGPYGCTLTLPKLVDPRFRVFSTPQIHSTKLKARRHVAFQAYRALYANGLLNDHLLPLTSVLEPEMESEVRALLREVEQRDGTAQVSSQMDPWRVAETAGEQLWWSTILEVDGLPPLRLLTQTALPLFRDDELPVFHTREQPPFKVRIRTESTFVAADDDDGILARARIFTRRFFWPLYSSRMKWGQMDFVHLFLPVDESLTVWDERRASLLSVPGFSDAGGRTLFAPFSWWDQHYGHVNEFSVVTGTGFGGKPFQFIRWKNDPVTAEERDSIVKRYVRPKDDDGSTTFDINYPLIETRPFSKRNFLTPMPAESKGLDAASQQPVLLLKEFSLVALISSHEVQYALWAPSIIRYLQLASTTSSMRDNLFVDTPLVDIPLHLLMEATSAPAAQEHSHYQRLETLGDTVLKYTVSIQLLSAHPLWHEGYLARRKDHAVSNANLSKMAVKRKLFRWIIRDRLVPKRWRPRLTSDPVGFLFEETSSPAPEMVLMTAKEERKASAARNLSTKVLADVVEALIGAAYVHGGFALGTECMKVFDLGLSWNALPDCIDAMYARVAEFDRYPVQITIVESILGYTFRRKAIAVEALAHASYQSDLETISYERMEFLGDAVLDMLVTDYLYRVPEKEYSPGQIHMIKTTVVNAHFLAMLCLRASTMIPAAMPSWSQHDGVTVNDDTQPAYLWQCMLHSNVRVMDEQRATFARWKRPGGQDEIEAAFAEGKAFPWSALTSLQAPKFLSDMFESLLGAVYLDSLGDLDTTREVLRRLGHWEVVERIVACDMDVEHPVSRLYLWASKRHEPIKCGKPEHDGKTVRCSVFWDDFEVAKVEDEWRGRISQETARFAAAEKAIALLEDPVSLLRIWLAKRNRSIEYSVNALEGVPVCSAIVDGTRIATVQSRESSEEEMKQAAATEALKILEAPVHWLAFLSVQHRLEVEYQIYEEEGTKVCCVYVDGCEAGKVEYPAKDSGAAVTEGEMTAAAAKKAVEYLDQRVVMDIDVDWA
ncbi:P-loop containing nucleoside triphosphate hydrolase protein [Lactarius hatsudake]|nr:P-loop containing nucleoside triphosphate hydrolase protein [Lactarius hatsudake]